MLSHTSSCESEERRKSNDSIRTTIKSTDKEKVPNPDNDKRKRESSDANFQKAQKKNKPSTQTSKKVNGPTRQPFVPISYNSSAEMKIQPRNLWEALKGLSDAQISAIKDMGFQSILSFNTRCIFNRLQYWLLVNYDHKRNELNLGHRRIKITQSKVHEVIGIPMGKITVTEKNIRKQGLHPTVDQFRTQFDQVKIRVEDVIEKLKANTDGGRLFKLNFLVLFNTILGETNTVAAVNEKFLTSIVNESDICKMDWCSYMITCLNRTKEKWNDKYPYNGPLILLAIVYAHHYHLNTETIVYDLRSLTINQVEGEREDEYENQHQSETQGEEQNQATHSKHHGLNLQMPIGMRTKRVIDDCITPPSLQSPSGMPGHRDIPKTPVDASVQKSASPQSDIVCIQGYKVKRSIAPILEAIFKKHGDIAANCIFKTSSARTYFLEVVCEVVRRIQTNDVSEKMEETECQVSDAEAANVNVSWIQAHLEAIHKRKETSLLMETKANTILVKRAAQMDLRERCAELVAAHERFKEAGRCARVLHLVEKMLNENILESKAKLHSCAQQPFL